MGEWKKDFMLYVIKHKIRHPKELDLSLVVDEVCPGQTRKSVSEYAHHYMSDYKKRRTISNLYLPLDEIIKMRMNDKNQQNPLFNEKKMEKYLQRKNDIVDLYKSMI